MFFFNVVRFRVFSFFLKRASNLPKSVDLVNTIFCSIFFQCGTFRVFSEVFPRYVKLFLSPFCEYAPGGGEGDGGENPLAGVDTFF